MFFWGGNENNNTVFDKYGIQIIIATLIILAITFVLYKKYEGKRNIPFYPILFMSFCIVIAALYGIIADKFGADNATRILALLCGASLVTGVVWLTRDTEKYKFNSLKNYDLMSSLSASLLSGTSLPSDLERWETVIDFFENEYHSGDQEEILSKAKDSYDSYLIKHYPERVRRDIPEKH